jgi:hypothetical protein
MILRTAIKHIQKAKPRTIEDFESLGFRLKRIGGGVFRGVYRIKSFPLVVKFPRDEPYDRHSRAEMRKIKKLSEFPFLRRYLPKVYYYDPKNGVIVMELYHPFSDNVDAADALGRLAGMLIHRLTGVPMKDIHTDNIRTPNPQRCSPRLVFCDLGY